MYTPTTAEFRSIGRQIIKDLCGRSGFDAAFDVDDAILAEIEEEMGRTAFEESVELLVDSY